MARPAKEQDTLQDIDVTQLTPGERLALKQLERMEKEEAEVEAKKNQDNEARKRNAKALQSQRENDLLKQKYCAHLKENGRTNLAGQRDHNGVVHLICQRCAKEFTGQVEYHLQPRAEFIGGPNQ